MSPTVALHIDGDDLHAVVGPDPRGAVEWNVTLDGLPAAAGSPGGPLADELRGDAERRGTALPIEAVAVAHPTQWGGPALAHALRGLLPGVAADVAAVPTAHVAAAHYLRSRALTRASVLVVEFTALSCTVAVVDCDSVESTVVACEHEPTLGTGDPAPAPATAERLAELADRVLDDRAPHAVLVVGDADPEVGDLLRQHLATPAFVPEVIALSGREIAKAVWTDARRATPGRAAALPGRQAMDVQATIGANLLARRQPPNRRSPLVIGAAVVFVALAAAAAIAGGTLLRAPADGSVADSPAVPGASRPTTPPPDSTAEAGRITVAVPAQWRPAGAADPERLVLTPDSAVRARITVTQSVLAAGAGADDVARDLQSKISRAEPGRFGNVQRDVVLGDRPGLAYDEFPGDGSEVRWHVIVDRGVQAGIGCQYGRGRWDTVRTACEEVARSLTVRP
ncbi:type VII secretion-associated protein [Nocardia asteroides]|uniref:type VII secretion-associated protein n=1 Tax=Nocardia asteroides TaxID=1824 RepID=UPI001E398188|nr:type VII secretion-associated protein [Nocardia asteroides]UGT60033.1 type VII secretion-associated protein [Nocardia asteroides]